nr:11808_t:CDS:2 [Entrophospora candida]
MRMLFNWDIEHLCVVFSWWHINSIPILILSCGIIILIGVIYEYTKYLSKNYDKKLYQEEYRSIPEDDNLVSNEEESRSRGSRISTRASKSQQVLRSLIYSIQTTLSLFIMLIFMTYNGFLIISVVLGAFIGSYIFSKNIIYDQPAECCI